MTNKPTSATKAPGTKTLNTNTSENLPKWIFYFGCILATFGVVAGIIAIVSPTKFFNDFPTFTQWAEISYITASWGIRSLVMGVVMIVALWLRTPSAIGLAFSMRFMTELGDLLNTLATGHGSMGMPLVLLTAVWMAIFLIPEALATRWGMTRALAMKR